MVTASHNPPQDNGYKVYLEDSSQIVPPADAEISAAIDAVGRVDEMPRSDAYELLGPEVAEAYVEAVVALPSDGPRDIVAVYTPMHGVGRDTLVEAVSRAGFPPLHVVRDQAEPDPDFPTVAFPNPEEPGAMDLALKLSSEVGADIIVANDPDADRCAVGRARRRGVPDAHRRPGRRAARRLPAAQGRQGHVRRVDRLVRPARAAGRGARSAVGADADRASSGSARSRRWSSATRRRWATASRPTSPATRTASRRSSRCSSSPPRSRPRAAR